MPSRPVPRLFDTAISLVAGETVCLVGPNGSGKTSLLHALAGIGAPGGSVSLDGVDPRTLGPSRRPLYLAFLPASRELAWPLAGRDLIALGGGGAPHAELALDDVLGRRVDSLSTGERSRVLETFERIRASQLHDRIQLVMEAPARRRVTVASSPQSIGEGTPTGAIKWAISASM